MQVNPYIACLDPILQEHAYSRLSTGTDEFHWFYTNVNRWQFQYNQQLKGYSKMDRCYHKVVQDFSFITLVLGDNEMSITTMETKVSTVDIIGAIGYQQNKSFDDFWVICFA